MPRYLFWAAWQTTRNREADDRLAGDANGFGGAGLNLPSARQTVNQVAPVSIPHGIGSGAYWFNPASFRSPPPLTFGNTSINIFNGPGFFDLDFSLFKNIAIRENWKIQLRVEAFNSTNTPQ